MQIEVDEKVVLDPILRESAKFRHFFEEEKKKVGLIHWIRVSDMPEGVEAYADVISANFCP